jgi:hypothetical protein
VKHDRVLKKFDLSQWTNKLCEKLSGIENFEAMFWRAVPYITDEVGNSTIVSDSVLGGIGNDFQTGMCDESHSESFFKTIFSCPCV